MKIVHLIAVILMFTTGIAHGGSRNNAVNPNLNPADLVLFSKQVERIAAKQGARVFILSRVGSPQADLPKGVQFTHTAIAVYSMITLDDGRQVPGYAVYNLYQEDEKPNRSRLVMDYAVNFFSGAQELKAGIAIPEPKLQQRILALIASGDYQKLHNPKYSVLSNPMNSRYQNCTEYVLDTINAAIYQTLDVAQLKANTKAYFTPQPIDASRLKLRLASMVMKDLTLRDHKGKVKTASYTTIVEYLREYGLLKFEQVLSIEELLADSNSV